jgi:SanA protein
MARALYDARHAGLDATGYVADKREYGKVMAKLRLREAAARIKTMGDVVTGADPHFLGPVIPISGDGRTSWD